MPREFRAATSLTQGAIPANAAGVVRFQAQAGQAITRNTPSFPVTEGDPFTIQVPMHTDLASVGSGYVALVFLDERGKEIKRLRLPFQPGAQVIGRSTTDAKGHFSLMPPPETPRASAGYRAKFSGDEYHRTVSSSVSDGH